MCVVRRTWIMVFLGFGSVQRVGRANILVKNEFDDTNPPILCIKKFEKKMMNDRWIRYTYKALHGNMPNKP